MIVKERLTWPQLVFSMKGSVIPRIWFQLVATTLVAVLVTALYWKFDIDKKRFSLTALPFSLIAVALAIFLGFRNNACYDRHWEGRKLWGQLVNVSRSLARQLTTLVARPFDPSSPAAEAADREIEDFHRDLVYRVIAFVHSLRARLREEALLPLVAPYLPKAEAEALSGVRNPPARILGGLADRLLVARRKGWLSDYHAPVLEGSLGELTSILGGCERIKSSPLPFAYTLLIHRIAGFYCFMLPFGIVDEVGMMTPVVSLLISYAFFGLDAIGDEIQDPFGIDPNDLPLASLSRTIEIDLRQRLGDKSVPDPLEPVDGILI